MHHIKNKFVLNKSGLNLTYFILLLALVFTSCNDTEKVPEVYVRGKIQNYPLGIINIEEFSSLQIGNPKTVQTDEEGNFIIELDSVRPNFYRLFINENNAIHLFLRPGDEIDVFAEYPIVPRTYSVTGSEDCSLLQKMNHELISSTDKLNELQDIYGASIRNPLLDIDSLRDEMIKATQELYIQDRGFLIGLIRENYKSPVIYAALYQYVLTNPILHIERDLEIFEFALESLQEYNPELEQTAALESEVSKYKLKKQQLSRENLRLNIGDNAPDFDMINIVGENVSLSSLRGKNVLLHFWASWSRLSRNDAEYLLNLRNQIDKNQLEIVQISLDTDKTAWKNAIKSDNTGELVHLSDFKMWESPVTKVYGLSSIPVNFLINPDGKVLMINILPEELVNTVPDLIKK
jgi:peroxiredoxin